MTAMNSPATAIPNTVYRGRRWVAVWLLLLVPPCLFVAVLTFTLDDAWLAVLLMGAPLTASAYLCAGAGWGEAIAHIELRDDGFSLVLPRYRGFFPAWPAQRLEAAWPEVKQLRRRIVRGNLAIFTFDYIRHVVVTDRGNAVLIEPWQTDFFGNPEGISQSIPAGKIMAEIARHTGLIPQNDSEVRGGGMLRNLLLGGPK